MRPQGSADKLEYRRLQAIRLIKDGRGMSEVMATVGCAKSSLSRWRKTYRKKGADGLKPKTASGRPLKITQIQQRKLLRLLTQGALKAGYSTDLWTTGRIAALIKRHFGISYHSDYIGPLLRNMGWSWQKPERRAIQRDEDAIEHWKKKIWPQIKKSAKTWGPSRIS
jgi:transposase